VRGETGKGANLAIFGGAIMALCSGRTKRARLSFPASFSLVRFFWASKRTVAKRSSAKPNEEDIFGLTKTGQLNSWLSNNYILVEVPDLLNRKDHYYL